MDSFKQQDNPAVLAMLRMLELAADWLNSQTPWLDSKLDVSKEGTFPDPVIMHHTRWAHCMNAVLNWAGNWMLLEHCKT